MEMVVGSNAFIKVMQSHETSFYKINIKILYFKDSNDFQPLLFSGILTNR